MFTSQSKVGVGGQRLSAMALQDSSNYLLSWVGYILLARTLVPPEIQWILKKLWALLMRPYTSFFCVFHVYERHLETGKKNDLFSLVELYLDIAGLLYGPPGTGKSSMIAAMANYLKYDVYDLELTQVYSNDGLKKLFRDTSSRSIVVIEDIDCSLNLAGKRNERPQYLGDMKERRGRRVPIREENVTLSALLNSVDGLWSCSTDERIIIFTTNHVEKLDPALIRPGRMDMRIHMSYCSFHAFKELARSYLSIDWHPDYDTIRKLMEEEGALITPAQAPVEQKNFYLQIKPPSGSMRGFILQAETNTGKACRRLQDLSVNDLQSSAVEVTHLHLGK